MRSAGPETGRRDAYFDFADPNLIEHANQGRHEPAMSSGLFGTDREFLLALPANRYSAKATSRHRRSVRRRVRLLDDWDVMGAPCAIRLGISEHGYPEHLLGSRAGRPEFAMLSLDSTVALLGTTWETGISSLTVPDPGDTEPVRRMLDRAANRLWDPARNSSWGHPVQSEKKRSHGCGAKSWPRRIRRDCGTDQPARPTVPNRTTLERSRTSTTPPDPPSAAPKAPAISPPPGPAAERHHDPPPAKLGDHHSDPLDHLAYASLAQRATDAFEIALHYQGDCTTEARRKLSTTRSPPLRPARWRPRR